MTDVHSKEVRRYNMSQIKSKDTNPELIVRKFLHKNGFRYRLHVKKLSGNPDIVLQRYNTAIFINGCFWHGHAVCNKFVVPKTRTEWWLEKINRNIERDKKNIYDLQKTWKVIILWECEIKEKLNDLVKIIKS